MASCLHCHEVKASFTGLLKSKPMVGLEILTLYKLCKNTVIVKIPPIASISCLFDIDVDAPIKNIVMVGFCGFK